VRGPKRNLGSFQDVITLRTAVPSGIFKRPPRGARRWGKFQDSHLL